MPLQEISDIFMLGIKGAMPAIIILALAYSLNSLSKEMGSASDHIDYIKTQFPYALVVAALCDVCYHVIGFVFA